MIPSKLKILNLAAALLPVILACNVARAQEESAEVQAAEDKSSATARARRGGSEQSLLTMATVNVSGVLEAERETARSSNPPALPVKSNGEKAEPTQATSEGWKFQVTPYLFFPALDGTVGARDLTANVNVSFADIFDNLIFAAMGAFEASKAKWLIPTDMMYVNLGDENATPGRLFSTVSTDTKLFVLGPKLGYRVAENEKGTFDVIGGFRFWHLSTELDFDAGLLAPRNVSESRNWVDPVVGARFTVNVSPKIFLFGKIDIGGFGAASDFTWQALGGGGYRFNERYSLLLGYRNLSVDYRKDGFVFDVNLHGLFTGAT